MYIGQKLKIYRPVQDVMLQGRTRRNQRTDWVNAEVAYIPKHGRFVDFRFFFRNIFGDVQSYCESYLMPEVIQMMKVGQIKEA